MTYLIQPKAFYQNNVEQTCQYTYDNQQNKTLTINHNKYPHINSSFNMACVIQSITEEKELNNNDYADSFEVNKIVLYKEGFGKISDNLIHKLVKAFEKNLRKIEVHIKEEIHTIGPEGIKKISKAFENTPRYSGIYEYEIQFDWKDLSTSKNSTSNTIKSEANSNFIQKSPLDIELLLLDSDISLTFSQYQRNPEPFNLRRCLAALSKRCEYNPNLFNSDQPTVKNVFEQLAKVDFNKYDLEALKKVYEEVLKPQYQDKSVTFTISSQESDKPSVPSQSSAALEEEDDTLTSQQYFGWPCSLL